MDLRKSEIITSNGPGKGFLKQSSLNPSFKKEEARNAQGKTLHILLPVTKPRK